MADSGVTGAPEDAPARAHPGGEAGDLIRRLDLAPHPEGGWFRETWRAPTAAGGRAASTAILFLLPAGEVSHWHAVDADEIWLHHGGEPLLLGVATAEGDGDAIRLGANLAAGESPQAVVPAGRWQAARPIGRYALVSCVVAPGFAFEGFTLAAPGWAPAGWADFLATE